VRRGRLAAIYSHSGFQPTSLFRSSHPRCGHSSAGSRATLRRRGATDPERTLAESRHAGRCHESTTKLARRLVLAGRLRSCAFPALSAAARDDHRVDRASNSPAACVGHGGTGTENVEEVVTWVLTRLHGVSRELFLLAVRHMLRVYGLTWERFESISVEAGHG
jgi:hypothetical protein